MKLVAYVRCSTEEQSLNGVSIEVQKERIAAFVKAKGLEGDMEFLTDAGYSGANLKRPGLQQIMQMKNINLIILKLDRLTRKLSDLLRLLELFEIQDITLISVSDSVDMSSANGRLAISLLGAIISWEREIIGERTKEALSLKRSQGYRVGAVPYGYRLQGKKLVPQPTEQAVIKEIFKIRKRELSYQTIADYLNDHGIMSKMNRKWHAKTVMMIVRREKHNMSFH